MWSALIDVARANLTTKRFPEIEPDWMKRQLAAIRCSPKYPETLAHTVMLARELCASGCLFYELFTTAVQYSASACEVALKEKFVEMLPVPCKMTKAASGSPLLQRVLAVPPSVEEFLYLSSDGWRVEGASSGFRPGLANLIRWAVNTGIIAEVRTEWFEHRRRMRNIIAHGHVMVVAPTWALGTLRETTMTLNQLFPDPETTAYDVEMRKCREEEARTWWLEIEGMLRSMPGDDGPDEAPEEPEIE